MDSSFRECGWLSYCCLVVAVSTCGQRASCTLTCGPPGSVDAPRAAMIIEDIIRSLEVYISEPPRSCEEPGAAVNLLPCGSATYELLAHHPQRATRRACGRCGCARRRLWCPKAFPGCPASLDHAASSPRRDWRCATRGVSEASSSTCSHLHGCVLLDSQPSRELAWSALGRLRSLHAVCAT